MGERCNRTAEVRGSIPLGSTSDLIAPRNTDTPQKIEAFLTVLLPTGVTHGVMKIMGKPSGLVRRKGSASWYFRQRWPKQFMREGARNEVWISLETSVYVEALAKIDDARRQAYDIFAQPAHLPVPAGIAAQSPRLTWPDDPKLPLLTTEQAAALARRHFHEALRLLDLEPPIPAHLTKDDLFAWRAERETLLARMGGQEPADGIDELHGLKVSVLREAGVRADPASDACNGLHNYLRRSVAQSLRIELARLDGDYSDVITDALFASRPSHEQGDVTSSETTRGGALSRGTSLDPELVDQWKRERKVSAKGVDKHRAVARWFQERIGPKPVQAITKQDVLTFKKLMVEEGVSAANANAKLSCLRTLFSYAVDNMLLLVNPATGVRVLDKDKDRRKRKEFDLPALHAIFRSPVYAAGDRPRGGRGEAAYWLPLISLYTGARLEEIAQLRATDVREEQYIDGDDAERTAWVICIMQEEGLSTKNANSERRVPVHPDLERLGLIRLVNDAVIANDDRLFPALRPNVYGKFGAKWGEWWSIYRREVCGVSDRRMVFHSFRHTFKYYARHVGMIEGVQRRIMGHSSGDTADDYGPSGYSLHQLVEGIRRYRIPGLILPPPPPQYR